MTAVDLAKLTQIEYKTDDYTTARVEKCIATLSRWRIIPRQYEDKPETCQLEVTFTPDPEPTEGYEDFDEFVGYYFIGPLAGNGKRGDYGMPTQWLPGRGVDDSNVPIAADLASEDPEQRWGWTLLGYNEDDYGKPAKLRNNCPMAMFTHSLQDKGAIQEVPKDIRALDGRVRGEFTMVAGKGKQWKDKQTGKMVDPADIRLCTDRRDLLGPAPGSADLTDDEKGALADILAGVFDSHKTLSQPRITMAVKAACKTDKELGRKYTAHLTSIGYDLSDYGITKEGDSFTHSG